MQRIVSCLVKSGIVLYPKIDFRLARLSGTSPNFKYKKYENREPCPLPPPPPKPKPTDDSLFWGTMFLATVLGTIAVYAKRSPEIRDWLTIYAPWFDDFIAVLYQENMTYENFARHCVDSLKKYIHLSDEKENCEIDSVTGKAIISKTDVTEKTSTPRFPPESLEPSNNTSDETSESPCKILPPPVLTKDICKVEMCLLDIYNTAINNYESARAACVYYNQLVEEIMTDFSIPKLKELDKAMNERLELVNDSLKNASDAEEDMEDLTRYLDCGVEAPVAAIDKVKALLENCNGKIKVAQIQFQWENDKSVALDKQWSKVGSQIEKYTEEAEVMMPGLQYAQNKLKLNGDPDLLLYHTYRYTCELQRQLDDVVDAMKERVNRAVDALLPQGEKATKEREEHLATILKMKRAEMQTEFKNREQHQIQKNEALLKDALNKQLQRHEENLKVMLKQREDEAKAKLNHLVAEEVAAQKRNFAKQRAEMAAKLKILEDKLAAHLKAEKDTKKSQELWAAAVSLLTATKKGSPRVKIDTQLKAIEKASGEEDKLVTTVIKTIPKSVWEEGVVPESVLKEQYYKMENIALKVSLVEQEGSPLPIYFMSWLQSMLLFFKVSGIPQIEVDKPPKEPSKDLDTFDLLQRARFWIEKGNLAIALRYVASLEGASLVAAESWLKAARNHLEVRQAAEAIVAHAAALGLQYI